MEKIREYLERILENPPIMGIIGLVLGIALGLVYGWAIDPVEWTDAAIPHLREDLKVEYLRMSIDSHSLRHNDALAKTRWDRMGEEAPQILEILESDPGDTLVSDIDVFSTAVGVASATGEAEGEVEGYPAAEAAGGEVEGYPADETAEEPSGFEAGNFFKWGLLVTALLAGVLVWRYLSAKRPSAQTPAGDAQAFTESIESTDYSVRGEGPPMHQFTTTYVLGDNLFDDSFSIESAAGEFLGECGIGISESIGVGEPKRVTAFEVWLFDQNDITTITKVLMSGHAYHDEAMLVELEKKGEPVLASPGSEFTLETNNLRIIARVMDMVYGEGPLPEESFFERMALELSIWRNTQVDSFTGPEYGEF